LSAAPFHRPPYQPQGGFSPLRLEGWRIIGPRSRCLLRRSNACLHTSVHPRRAGPMARPRRARKRTGPQNPGVADLMLSPCAQRLLSPEMGRKDATTQSRLELRVSKGRVTQTPAESGLRRKRPRPLFLGRPLQAVALAFYHVRRIQGARGRTQGAVSPSCRARHDHRLKKSTWAPNVRGREPNRRNEFDPAIGAAAHGAYWKVP
jgi:hypothetical protein